MEICLYRVLFLIYNYMQINYTREDDFNINGENYVSVNFKCQRQRGALSHFLVLMTQIKY